MPRYILVTCTTVEAARIIDADWYTSTDDVTEAIDCLVGAGGALGRAVKARIAKFNENEDVALDELTANGGRSYLQEDGLDALHAFLDAANIGYEP